MDEQSEIATLDVATLERWINGDAAVADLLAELPFLRSEADAIRFIEDIRVGLDDVKHGRTVPHAQVVRDMEERRRRYRAHAAE